MALVPELGYRRLPHVPSYSQRVDDEWVRPTCGTVEAGSSDAGCRERVLYDPGGYRPP